MIFGEIAAARVGAGLNGVDSGAVSSKQKGVNVETGDARRDRPLGEGSLGAEKSHR